MDDTHPVPAEILDEMVTYYRDRAPEYDAWFERRGNYDHGEAANAHMVGFAAKRNPRGASRSSSSRTSHRATSGRPS